MATVKYLADIDLNKNALNNAVIQPLSTAPGSPADGQIYFDTDTADINVYNGSAWVRLGPTGAGDIEAVVAGAGLTGGSDTGTATLNVIGGTGITANANDIALTNGLIADGSNITSVGTIGTGVWNGTAIAANKVATLNQDTTGNAATITVGSGSADSNHAIAFTDGTGADTSILIDGGLLYNPSTNRLIATLQTASQPSITGVGTINTGVWQGTTIKTAYIGDDQVTEDKLANTLLAEIDANTAKVTNVATNLSVASSTTSRIIASSDGTNATIPVATTSVSGVMSTGIFDAVVLNTAKSTNATHSGEVTGSGALTIADNVVDEANLKVSNSASNGYFLSAQSGNTGGLTWAAIPTLNQNTTGSAATLTTARAINGVDFNGSAAITVTAAAGTLSGNTLKSTVVASSLTSVGTIATGVWNGTVIADAYLSTNTAHLSGAQTFTGSKTMGTNVKLNFRDANAYINSPTANDIEVVGTTITLDAASDIQLEGNTTVTGNFSVSGNLNVDGTTTTIDSTTVAIADSMLKLAKDQAVDADALDFGFYGQYGDGSVARYAGVYRDVSVSGDPFTFFDGTGTEPGTTVNVAANGFDLADISAGGITAADGFAGDLTGDVTGKADTADTLETARTIGGVSFNGSANINLPGVNSAGNQNTTGSAATLTTARTIGGVSFNGSANINLPGVNAAGNQATSGLAGTATALATARAINGVDFDGTAAITVTAAAGTLSGNTLKSTVVASSLTSVGTIGTGVWRGTAIESAYMASATASAKGAVELATTAEALAGSDTTRAVTAAGLAARSYRAAIGDGSATAIAVTHSLGTKDVMVQMYDADSFETVIAQVVRNTTAQVTVTFNVAPTAGDVIILITKID